MNAFKILRWVLNWESPIFLPLPSNVEESPYTYVFVAMELSGNWLGTGAEGRRKVSEGYVNFATQLNDYILVFAIQKYLLREGEGFYITDLGGSCALCGQSTSGPSFWDLRFSLLVC